MIPEKPPLSDPLPTNASNFHPLYRYVDVWFVKNCHSVVGDRYTTEYMGKTTERAWIAFMRTLRNRWQTT